MAAAEISEAADRAQHLAELIRTMPGHGKRRDGSRTCAGNGTIVEPRLYQLIRQPKAISDRRFEIEFLDAGAEAFAFTFG